MPRNTQLHQINPATVAPGGLSLAVDPPDPRSPPTTATPPGSPADPAALRGRRTANLGSWCSLAPTSTSRRPGLASSGRHDRRKSSQAEGPGRQGHCPACRVPVHPAVPCDPRPPGCSRNPDRARTGKLLAEDLTEVVAGSRPWPPPHPSLRPAHPYRSPRLRRRPVDPPAGHNPALRQLLPHQPLAFVEGGRADFDRPGCTARPPPDVRVSAAANARSMEHPYLRFYMHNRIRVRMGCAGQSSMPPAGRSSSGDRAVLVLDCDDRTPDVGRVPRYVADVRRLPVRCMNNCSFFTTRPSQRGASTIDRHSPIIRTRIRWVGSRAWLFMTAHLQQRGAGSGRGRAGVPERRGQRGQFRRRQTAGAGAAVGWLGGGQLEGRPADALVGAGGGVCWRERRIRSAARVASPATTSVRSRRAASRAPARSGRQAAAGRRGSHGTPG